MRGAWDVRGFGVVPGRLWLGVMVGRYLGCWAVGASWVSFRPDWEISDRPCWVRGGVGAWELWGGVGVWCVHAWEVGAWGKRWRPVPRILTHPRPCTSAPLHTLY